MSAGESEWSVGASGPRSRSGTAVDKPGPATDLPDTVTAAYRGSLREYLARAAEADLQRAYELGRDALSSGQSLLDLASLHHSALVDALRSLPAPPEAARVADAAGRFFIESLSPFEFTYRGFWDAVNTVRESEQRYRSLVENARDVIYTLSTDGRITALNPAFQTITGWSRVDWIGKFFGPLVHPDDLPRAMELLLLALQGSPPRIFELRIVSKGGEHIPGEFAATPLIQDGKVAGILGIARDITERKRAQDALRQLNDMLEERAKQIAHALHDEAGQLLATVYLAIGELARDLPAQARKRVQEVRNRLDKVHEELRRISHELRPTVLDDLGLLPALEFLAEGVSKRTGLTMTVEGSTGGRLPPLAETGLYRSVQECLTNVIRHARARRVRIGLSREEQSLRCVVSDDGAGFDVPSVRSRRGPRGLGLIGIQERLDALGGTLQITSAPDHGTELVMTVPVKE